MLVLDNSDRKKISRLISILRRHPKKAMSPEPSDDGIMIEMKYTDAADLLTIIHHIRDSVQDTSIKVPFYYRAVFPTHIHDSVKNGVKYFFILYMISILTYVGAYVKTATDSHTVIDGAYLITYALITGLVPSITAVLVREKKISSRKDYHLETEGTD